MSYKTVNEFEHFNFKESYIASLELSLSNFHAYLDHVTILPENSKNRDIREMRTNGLCLTIKDATITNFVEEGYKVYDADGNLKPNMMILRFPQSNMPKPSKPFPAA